MTPPAFAPVDAYSSFTIRASEPAKRDIELLQSHLQRCGRETPRWSDVRTTAASVHHFLAPRFATTLTLMLVVIVTVSLAI